MISQLKISRTIAKYALPLILLTISFSCRTEIPKMDTTPPTIRFSIVGPGVNITFNDPAEAAKKQINLQVGSIYTITCLVSDAGGVSMNRVRMGTKAPGASFGPFTDQNGAVLPEESLSIVESAFTATGDRTAPLTGLVVRGTLTVNVGSLGFNIRPQGADFGGATADFNTIQMSVNMFSAGKGEVIDF